MSDTPRYADFIDAQIAAGHHGASADDALDLIRRLDAAGSHRLASSMRMRLVAKLGYEPHGAGPGSVADLLVGPVSAAVRAGATWLGLREHEPPRVH